MSAGGFELPSQSEMSTSPPNGIMSGSSAAVNPKLRKRTKTGCLTCRKRRIKCGEERPTCNNCIKSKRHCEGYNQRVIWKPPIGDLSGVYPASTSMQYATAFLPHSALPRPVPPPILTQDPALKHVQNRSGYGPVFEEPQSAFDVSSAGQLGVPFGGPRSAPPLASSSSFSHPGFTPTISPQSAPFPPQQLPQGNGLVNGQHFPSPNIHTPPQTDPNVPPAQQFHSSPNFDQQWQHPPSIFPPTPASTSPDFKSTLAEAILPTPAPTLTSHPNDKAPFIKLEATKPPYWESSTNGQPQQDAARRFSEQKPSLHPESPRPIKTPTGPAQSDHALDQLGEPIPGPFNGHYVSPTQLLDEAAVEYEDDDYYDVQSDEEVDVAPSQAMVKAYEAQRDFGMILALHRENTNEWSMRRYDNFIYAGILDYYRAEWVASPLKNPKTARVFAHFISATGPTLSIFERHPRNTSAIFDESPSPSSQQGLWTYALPMMALNHQGLLHAMLALSSLHIAKLQQASITPSFKHYAYSLKRLRHCLSHPKKRHLPTTLAATLLLGFYEVMTADHLKWSSHLLGAKQLLVEIDYHLMAKEARKLKALAKHDDHFNFGVGEGALGPSPLEAQSDSSVIDENLVSTIAGRKINYDEFGQVIDEAEIQKKPSDLPEPFDLSRYDLYQDLFWWYAKQDAYQSIVGGNGLLLDYNRWADCPPRAAVNRPDAIYGTSDHLLLLLGRVADFQFRDRARKARYVDSIGGQWRPPPGFNFGTSPPGGPQSQQHTGPSPTPTVPHQQTPQQPQQPTFYGMAPIAQQSQMPASYRPQQNGYSSPSPSTTSTELDLETATANAIEEWSQIQHALEMLASRLGPGFQPLSAEYHHQPAFDSPFNGVLQYRSYDIAIMWAIYYMTHIILIRSHPHMPPAGVVAAGIAAPQTAHYAQLIGQIAFGIVPTPRGQPLNPSLGGTLCEICMPLFFAGVQYQSPAQRNWLVARVRGIEALTGWASVGMIAHGCETAWQKAAEAGRGPPYERVKVDQVEFWTAADRLRRRGREFANGEHRDLTDRRFVHVHPPTRIHWAMGLLSGEDDVGGTPTSQQPQPQPPLGMA